MLGRNYEEKWKLEGCPGAPRKDLAPAQSVVKMEAKDCIEGQ